MPHEPFGREPRHDIIRIVDPFPRPVAQRKGQRVSDLVGSGGTEVGFVWHGVADKTTSTWAPRFYRAQFVSIPPAKYDPIAPPM